MRKRKKMVGASISLSKTKLPLVLQQRQGAKNLAPERPEAGVIPRMLRAGEPVLKGREQAIGYVLGTDFQSSAAQDPRTEDDVTETLRQTNGPGPSWHRQRGSSLEVDS
jgi:hypothetical protein